MPVLKGELFNENRMREPICLKYREGLVRASDWARLHKE